MTRQAWLAVLTVTACAACAQPTPEQQIIDDAAAALGGRDRIESAATLRIAGNGVLGYLGQDMTPETTELSFTLSDYTRDIDLSAVRFRTEQTRTPTFPYFRGLDPIPETFGLDGDVAYSVGADNSASRQSDVVATDWRAAYYHHPLTLVRAALDPAATVTNVRSEGAERLADITTADGIALTLAIDSADDLLTRISSLGHHENLGDVTNETRFAEYRETDGLMLPTRLTSMVDDYTLLAFDATSHQLDGDVGDLAAPEAAASAAPITAPPAANVTVEDLGDGLWFLAGESHNSVLAEFSDHLLLIEAPNEVRTLAVIETARELVPDKPLTHLVNSHHHFDHSAGIRAAVSEGLTIITHADNAAFYRELVDRPRTIGPDALTANPQPLTVESVEDALTHEDDTMSVELYHIADSPHADTLLMAYFPRQRVLAQADPFSTGRSFNPYAANLLENIRRLGLRVDRLAPVHGEIAPFDALVSVVEAGTN